MRDTTEVSNAKGPKMNRMIVTHPSFVGRATFLRRLMTHPHSVLIEALHEDGRVIKLIPIDWHWDPS